MWQALTNIFWWYCCQYLLHGTKVYIYILFQQEVVKLYTAYTRSQAVLVDKGLIEPICGLTPTFLSLVSPS
jgi:hypothetical protein